MRGNVTEASSAGEAIRDTVGGRKIRGSRHAANAIGARVTDDELVVIAKHARDGGYGSIAEYVRAVTISPKAVYDTDPARTAKPLSDVAYRIARTLDALNRSETDAVRGYLAESQRIIATALAPLRREHDTEVRARG